MSKIIKQLNDELECMKHLKPQLENQISKLKHLLKTNNQLDEDQLDEDYRPKHLKDKSLGQVKVLKHLIVDWLSQSST